MTNSPSIRKREGKIKGEYWIELPEKEYNELIERAIKTNMPVKQWRKEMKELARKVLEK